MEGIQRKHMNRDCRIAIPCESYFEGTMRDMLFNDEEEVHTFYTFARLEGFGIVRGVQT